MNGEYDIDSLSKVINNQARNIAAVELFEKGFSDSKAVFYCVSIEHAQSLEKIFQERGIPVGLVTGDTKKTDRERCFADLEEGKIRALINVKVLIEGFDVPSVNVVFNLAPTCSLVDAEQRGGRGIRLDPSNPDKVGYVIDFIDQDNDDGNSKRHILFSQILGSSVVTGISYGGKNVKKKKFTKPPRVIPKIAGLKVVTRHEEIMKITHDYERVQQKRLNKYPQQKDGWKSLDMLVDHFKNQPKGRIYKRIKSFHPGEKQVDSTDGSIKLFYPPDAYMSLASASDWEISQQKDGWKNLDMLVAEFKNHTEDDIYKRIKKYSSGEVYLDALSGKKGIFYPSSVWMCVGIELGIGYNLNIPDGYIDTIQMKYKMRYASSDAY